MPRPSPRLFRQLWFLLVPHQSPKQSSSMSWTYRYGCLLLASSGSRVLNPGSCISLVIYFPFSPCPHTLLVRISIMQAIKHQFETSNSYNGTHADELPAQFSFFGCNQQWRLYLPGPSSGRPPSHLHSGKCFLERNGLKLPNTQVESKKANHEPGLVGLSGAKDLAETLAADASVCSPHNSAILF